jgi:hypothetical protein
MKCKCFICETEGEFVESTDVICRPCYNKLERQRDELLAAMRKIGKTITALLDNADTERFSRQDAKDSDYAYSEGKFRGLEDAEAEIGKIINTAISNCKVKKGS